MPFIPVLFASIAFMSAGSTGAGAAQSVAVAPPAPVVEEARWLGFSPETLDLGEMIASKPKSGTLTITNITNEPLTIVKIKGACGCTTVSAPPEDPLPAGGSFKIEITVDPGTKTGVDLAKLVHFALESGKSQSMTVKGHVKTVVRVSPDVVDASLVPEGANGVITLERVDLAPFKLTGIEPAGLVQLPVGPSAQHTLTIDWQKWIAAGHPTKLTVTTDTVDAEKLVIPIKTAPAVVMFRLPAASPDALERSAIEVVQDAVIHAIDAGFAASGHSRDFKMKIHRETGMLFVYGTESDVAKVRDAVAALPASVGVRESSSE